MLPFILPMEGLKEVLTMLVRSAIRMAAIAAMVAATLLGSMAMASAPPATISSPVHVATAAPAAASGSVTVSVTIRHRIEISVDDDGTTTVRTNCPICAADLAGVSDATTAIVSPHGD